MQYEFMPLPAKFTVRERLYNGTLTDNAESKFFRPNYLQGSSLKTLRQSEFD